jgi:hypothetical protein
VDAVRKRADFAHTTGFAVPILKRADARRASPLSVLLLRQRTI